MSSRSREFDEERRNAAWSPWSPRAAGRETRPASLSARRAGSFASARDACPLRSLRLLRRDGNRQAFAALGATTAENITAALGGHSRSETVRARATTITWSICRLHFESPLNPGCSLPVERKGGPERKVEWEASLTSTTLRASQFDWREDLNFSWL